MTEDYGPFELVEEDGRTILRLHGTAEQRAKVEADKVHIIMDAIAQGWDIDVRYADIEGDLDIEEIANELGRTENGKLVIKGNIGMLRCSISGDANFGSAQFSGDAHFGYVQFSGDAYFEYTRSHFLLLPDRISEDVYLVARFESLSSKLEQIRQFATTTKRGEYDLTPRKVEVYDEVDCTVFAQKEVRVGDSVFIQVFAHIPEEAEKAKVMAKEFDRDTHRLNFTSLGTLIQRGSELGFELIIPQIEVEDSFRKLTWRGRTISIQFVVDIPKDFVSRNLIGKVLISQDTIPIGQVIFKLRVIREEESKTGIDPSYTPTEAHRYQNAFISYSSKDRSEVFRRTQMLEAVGIKYNQDILKLKPGDRWLPVLFSWIDESDVFFLFWSNRAKRSKWVRKEWKRALRHPQPYSILPITIEEPPIPKPPKELEHLHFGSISYFLMWSFQSVLQTAKPDSETKKAQFKYVANWSSDVFHSTTCQWAARISEVDEVYFQTFQEATDSGRLPCKICKPREKEGDDI